MMASRLLTPARICLGLGIFVALGATSASAGLATDWAVGHASRARLIAGNGVAGVEVEMADGWKTYWRTPGDAGGVAPSFDWSKSGNLAAAKVLYPAPKRFSDSAGDTVGYKGTVVFPVVLTPKDPKKPIDLRLDLDYGVCNEICIPAQAKLSLAISPDAERAASDLLAEALKHVPAPASARRPGDPVLRSVHAELSGAKPRIVLKAEFPDGAQHADIFVEAPQDAYVPLPKKVSEDGAGEATFEVDLSDGVDLAALKGKTLTATLVSDKGQSEAKFPLD
jgi:DsbC/DsbD-like thiol-disulfide interchange protein